MQSIPIGPTVPVVAATYYALPATAVIFNYVGITPVVGFGIPGNGLSNSTFPGVSGDIITAPFLYISSGSGTVTLSKVPTLSKYAQRVIKDGASNYWNLGEKSGLVAKDSIGGVNGTISGGVTLNQSGAVSGDTAMTFNGTTGQIVTAANVLFPLAVTIEVWIKRTDLPAFQPAVSNGGGGNAVEVGTSASGGVAKLYIYGGGAVLYGLRTFPSTDGLWHHAVWVLDGTTAIMYLDGIVDTMVACVRTSHTAPGQIGQSGGSFTSGTLDEVAIYPRALTAQEISAHYNAR